MLDVEIHRTKCERESDSFLMSHSSFLEALKNVRESFGDELNGTST